MQFLVMMRDGSRYRIEAAYIEVIHAEESSYTFLGPVPGYASAILATFPVCLVTAVLPYNQMEGFKPVNGSNGQSGADRAAENKVARKAQLSAADS